MAGATVELANPGQAPVSTLTNDSGTFGFERVETGARLTVRLADGTLLPGIVDFFEESAAAGTGVRQLLGYDVASFCDGLIQDSRTYADVYQESIRTEPGTAEKQPP